jgi:hypothetical protein
VRLSMHGAYCAVRAQLIMQSLMSFKIVSLCGGRFGHLHRSPARNWSGRKWTPVPGV